MIVLLPRSPKTLTTATTSQKEGDMYAEMMTTIYDMVDTHMDDDKQQQQQQQPMIRNKQILPVRKKKKNKQMIHDDTP
jgi:hypothetical protein